MSNIQNDSPLQALLDQKILNFVSAFCDSSRQMFVNTEGVLIHPGEFGTYREAITKEFLKAFVPQRLGIDSGFVINTTGRVSTQCDLVMYDKSSTPLLNNENLQRFFPAESVCAVGEVKSVLSLAGLKSALRKLAAVKESLHK